MPLTAAWPEDLATLRFADERSKVLLIGPPGVICQMYGAQHYVVGKTLPCRPSEVNSTALAGASLRDPEQPNRTGCSSCRRAYHRADPLVITGGGIGSGAARDRRRGFTARRA